MRVPSSPMRAAIDWSYDLLGEAERRFFDGLAVFAGGWTVEAAEAVGVGEGIEGAAVLDLLARLVDKSLVLAENSRTGLRATGCWRRCGSTDRITWRRWARRKRCSSGTPAITWRWGRKRSGI